MKTLGRALALAFTIGTVPAGCAQIMGKTVAGKQPPNTLVASDGSICIVSEERFDKTEVGMKALCAWRGGSRMPPPRLAPAVAGDQR